MFQTFVFAWCDIFAVRVPSFGSSYTCSAPPTTRRTFQKCTCIPPHPPTRTRSARVRCFSFFAFTSSPYDDKELWNSDLRVKASPLFPSPVKAKKGHFLHMQNTLYQWITGEGEGWRQELQTRWVRDAQGRVRSRVRRCGWGNRGGHGGRRNERLFKKSGQEEENRCGVSKESPQVLIRTLLILKNRNIFLAKPSIVRN